MELGRHDTLIHEPFFFVLATILSTGGRKGLIFSGDVISCMLEVSII